MWSIVWGGKDVFQLLFFFFWTCWRLRLKCAAFREVRDAAFLLFCCLLLLAWLKKRVGEEVGLCGFDSIPKNVKVYMCCMHNMTATESSAVCGERFIAVFPQLFAHVSRERASYSHNSNRPNLSILRKNETLRSKTMLYHLTMAFCSQTTHTDHHMGRHLEEPVEHRCAQCEV